MRKLLNSELNRLSVNEFKLISKHQVIVILDNIRSLHNVGSLFRTADAFRLQSLYLCGITATPPHNEIHKTALGAEESMDWRYFEDTMEAVQYAVQEGYLIYSVEQAEKSTLLTELSIAKDKKYAFIFGNEVRGVQQQVINHSDCCIEIPQFGTKHSLNVSVSAGIVLWEVFKQLQ
jgi:tRNA G18 (ribose-2'-O)-methylase SpoU